MAQSNRAPLFRTVSCTAIAALWVGACSGPAKPSSPESPVPPAAERYEHADQIDRYLEQAHQVNAFNGVVLIAKDGAIQYERSIGVADIEADTPLTDASSFRLASVSKQFIAMAIMILNERGKLDYDDPLERFLPELPYEGITIRHLLHHTSGLPDYMAVMDAHWDAGQAHTERRIASNEDVVAVMAEHGPPVEFAPNERFAYSNTGYTFLGTIVARASGESIHDFMQKNIFGPLGMNDSGAFVESPDFLPGRRVFGFRTLPDGTSREPNDGSFLNESIGDGGLYASARDLLRWDQALYTETLISQRALTEAFQPARLASGELTDYGFGWTLELEDGTPTVVKHGGAWVGFRTLIRRDLANKATLIVLTSNSNEHFGAVTSAVDRLARGETVEPPKPPVSRPIARAIASGESDLETVYTSLQQAKPDEYDFSEPHLNVLGYFYLLEGQHDHAIAVFRLNAKVFPNSYNVHDSLAEGLAATGDTEGAIAGYRRSVELFPPSPTGIEALTKLGAELPPPYEPAEGAFDDIIGTFVFADLEFELEIRRDGDQVMGAMTGEPPFPILAATEASYYAVEPPAQLVPERAADGSRQLVLRSGRVVAVGVEK